MNIFDLLFIALFLAAVVSLLTACGLAIAGRFRRAGRILRWLLLCASAYMAVVVLVSLLSLLSQRRVLGPTATQCFDDWCIGVDRVSRSQAGESVKYSVDLRLSSRARRVAQREKNMAVYLTDDRGRRYDPVRGAAPFDVLLQAGESAIVNRTFMIPAAAKSVALVAAHEGGFPIGWFIIGYDTWFRKPPLVQLQ